MLFLRNYGEFFYKTPGKLLKVITVSQATFEELRIYFTKASEATKENTYKSEYQLSICVD